MPTISSYTAERISEIEAATIVGGYVDGNGDLILVRFDDVEINAGPVVGPEGPTGPGGGLLAFHAYDPDPPSVIDAVTQSFVDVDPTNLAITFTAPASGKVLVELSGYTVIPLDQTSSAWALREGSSRISYGVSVLTSGSLPGAISAYTTAEFYISGLTPASVHTYKWAHKSSNITGGRKTQLVYGHTGGTDAGVLAPAIMKVQAVP